MFFWRRRGGFVVAYEKKEETMYTFSMTLAALVATALFAAPVAAAPVPWVGSADYTLAPGAGGDEEAVGPFDAYDAGPGVALILGATSAQVGDVLNGYFQSYVTAHTRGSVAVPTSRLNTQGVAGDGSGYELTVVGSFTEQVTNIVTNTTLFEIVGGSVDIYFDTSPDYDFQADSGFTDTASILSGTIIGGGGSFTSGSPFSFGGAGIDIRVDSFDAAVFGPDTIATGASLFTLQITPNNAAFLAPITTVGGHPYDSIDDLLVVADGNLDLYAVPEPLSLALVGSTVIGLVVLRRRA